MKKVLILTVSIFVCGLMLLAGCGTPSTSLPNELTGHTGDYPETINIFAPDFFKETGAANTDQAKQEWLDEMSEWYGVSFNIISDFNSLTKTDGTSSSTDSSASSQAPVELSEDEKFVGLVSVSTDYIQNLKACTEKDTLFYNSFVPLDNYLADNPIWNALPDDFKSLFEIDGHIYAIPTSVIRAQYARIIHNEAYLETGITVIDLDSFRDFALAYAEETGKVTSNLQLQEVMDILNAFGLYPGRDSSTQFSYDPTEDCYVDFMTKGAAVEALEYLRELYSAGAFSSEGTNVTDQLFQDSFFASKYKQYFDYDDCTEVLSLNPEYPQVLFTSANGFAMTRDTPQPQETVNILIDMLFGSEQNYLQCRLGSSKSYTLNSDGTITIGMAQDSEGNYVKPGIPNLAGELSDIFPYTEADILYSKNGVVTTASVTDSEEYNASVKLLNDSLENGSAIEIPPDYQIIQSATYDANITNFEILENNVGNQHDTYFGAAIKMPFKSVQQWLDEYKEQMFNLGGNAMLDEMNAAIGKKTAYYYG